MNEIVARSVWLTGQITLLALAATALCVGFSRRRPGAGAGIAAAGLGGMVVLTLLATMPLPGWWSWTGLLLDHPDAARETAVTDAGLAAAPEGHPNDTASSPGSKPASDSRGTAEDWSLSTLSRMWGRLIPAVGRAARRSPVWRWSVGFFIVGGVGFCLARLLLGLYAVRRYQTNSLPLEDLPLLTQIERLRLQMRCRRQVQVREAIDIGGPVTVGWWIPIILLPPQWRYWGRDEIEAVLAHELAHVCHADYAVWLLARLSVALHFYHPLAHWLAARLHVQQELAADALGARHAGGRQVYVRALARLALRQDEALYGGPARAFLPARGTLQRRIAMLRTEERSPGRAWPRTLAMLVLGVAALGVSALRGPARAGDKLPATSPEAGRARTPAQHDGEKQKQVQRPPFEYCYSSADAAGFFAFRPSVYFGADPRMKRLADETDKDIGAIMKKMIGPAALPKIEEIEQFGGCIFLKINTKAPKGQRGMLFGSLLTVRTTQPFDWKKTIACVAHKVTEMPCAGHVYYKVLASDFKSPAIFGMVADSMSHGDGSVCFFQPDPRTLAIGSEQQFREMIQRGPSAKPAWATAAGWERVEHGVFALAINNNDGRFAKLWLTAPPEDVPEDVNAAMAKTTCMVMGLDYDGDVRADLLAACANQQDAILVSKAMLRWLSQGQATISAALQKPPHDAGPWLHWCKEFLDQTRVGLEHAAEEPKHTMVHLQGHAKGNLAELFDFLSGAKVEAVETKGK